MLDANVPIRARADHHPTDRLGPFWEWLTAEAEAGRVKMPREIYEEVAKPPDLLGRWLRRPEVRKAIILAETTDLARVRLVISQGCAPDLDDVELPPPTRDPFLVAAALGGPDRVVVTREVSAPGKKRARRKVPDVCVTMGVECIDDHKLWRRLDFRVAQAPSVPFADGLRRPSTPCRIHRPRLCPRPRALPAREHRPKAGSSAAAPGVARG